jgi:hypothetical protein
MGNRLVTMYGTRWARNKANIKRLRDEGSPLGVYVLCDGSMPVYIGKGKLASRLARHRRSKTRGQFWDHFSWYAIPDRDMRSDVEALLVRMLPFYLRSLNKVQPGFRNAQRVEEYKKDLTPDPIKPARLAPKRKH